MNIEVRMAVKNCLREHLLGKNNVVKRNNLLAALDISDSTVKSWTSLTDSKIPVTEDLPTICNVLGITLNQLFGIEDATVVEALLLKKAFDNSEHQGSIKSLLPRMQPPLWTILRVLPTLLPMKTDSRE